MAINIGDMLGKFGTGTSDILTGKQKIFGKAETYKPGDFKIDEDLQKDASSRSQVRQGELQQELSNIKNRKDVALDTTNQDAVRANQAQLVNRLQQSAAGTGPSAAQSQLQLGTDRNLRAALASAASSRGNPALAAQAANRERAVIGQEAAAQAASLRAQEQQQAQGLLADTLSGQRSQDMDMSRTNLQAALEQQKMRDQASQFYESGISQQIGSQTASDLSYQDLLAQNFRTQEQARSQAASGAAAAQGSQNAGIMGGIATLGAAGIAAMSDERVKKNVSDLDEDALTEFFKALEAKNYEYKNPGTPGQSEGEKLGLMAQDVENTELGKKLIGEDEEGYRNYDPQVLDGILLAATKKLMNKVG